MNQLMRHFLATIAFRFQRSIAGSKAEFGDFQPGNGIRSPKILLNHMRNVLEFANAKLMDRERIAEDELNWEAEISGFLDALKEMDQIFKDMPENQNLMQRMMQGPLSDVLTHVGQLSMLRRMYGEPIPGINFFVADIRNLDQ